jgi:6-phosphogluconolactonase
VNETASMSFERIVCEDAGEMAERVAARLRDLTRAPGDQTVFIALSGGSTPRRLYELLAGPPWRDEIDWKRIEVFFGDERPVPPHHPDSNYGMAERALLSKVPVKAHRMRAEHGEAEAYEKLLGERIAARAGGVPVLDLILLGMGPDGHTASLFPDTAALRERERLVVMNEVPKLVTRRMTITFPLIQAARRVWLLVAGADKRETVRQCLEALDEPVLAKLCPAALARPTEGELVWWLDRAAAGALG